MKQWSQGTRYQKTKDSDPWEMENKEDEPCDCPSFLPGERVSRLQQSEGKLR